MRTKIALFLALCLSLLLTGCGTNTLPTAGSSTPNTTLPGTPIVVKSVTPAVNPSPSAPAQPGVSGPVTVQTSATFYHPGDTIVVTVSNRTDQVIYFPNHQTNCTIVLLERQAGSTWQSVGACKEMIVTIIQSLNGQKSLVISLKAGLTPWPAGSYRVAFHYMTHAATGAATPQQDIFSPLFQVS